MSTPPPDFFGPDNEPRPTEHPDQDRRGAAPNSADTGSHRAPPAPPWGTPTPPDAPQHNGDDPRRTPSAPPAQASQPTPQTPSSPPAQPHQPQSAPPGHQAPAAGPSEPPPAPPQPPSAPARHQQPYRPTQSPQRPGAPSPRWQGPNSTEQTTVLTPQQLGVAREQAAHDPGVGDFFGPPPGSNPAASQGEWPQPHSPQNPPSGPLPRGDAFGMTADPFGGGHAGARGGDAFGAAQPSAPLTGWRKAVSLMTFGLAKPGPSAKQVRIEEQLQAIRASLLDVYVVAFVNSKGGVGKTTMAVAAGNAIARERGDRVIVVDVDTDLGNLSARFREDGGPRANIEALASVQNFDSYQSVRVFTVQNDDRLEMLSSQNDPSSNYLLTSEDFTSAMRVLRAHYNVILLDFGTSITSSLFRTIAAQVNCLVVVSSSDAPGLNGAWRTLKWLETHGFSNLLPRTVFALNATSGDKPALDMAEAEATVREKTPEIVKIPYDKHLHEGGVIEFPRMAKKTRKAVMELAASIAQHYPSRQSRQRPEEMGRY